MKILIFTEGTALTFESGEGLTREQQVERSKQEGIQREEISLSYNSIEEVPIKENSVHDYANYIPIGNVVEKLTSWKKEGATIYYLTSRRVKKEIDNIKNVLQKYHFPDFQNLLFRRQGESYADIAERIMPDILIEDDCESIGGEKEMTYPHIKPEFKKRIKSIVVKEFEGIDRLSDGIEELKVYE